MLFVCFFLHLVAHAHAIGTVFEQDFGPVAQHTAHKTYVVCAHIVLACLGFRAPIWILEDIFGFFCAGTVFYKRNDRLCVEIEIHGRNSVAADTAAATMVPSLAIINAEAEATEMIASAEAQAEEIIAAARAEASEIIDTANAKVGQATVAIEAVTELSAVAIDAVTELSAVATKAVGEQSDAAVETVIEEFDVAVEAVVEQSNDFATSLLEPANNVVEPQVTPAISAIEEQAKKIDAATGVLGEKISAATMAMASLATVALEAEDELPTVVVAALAKSVGNAAETMAKRTIVSIAALSEGFCTAVDGQIKVTSDGAKNMADKLSFASLVHAREVSNAIANLTDEFCNFFESITDFTSGGTKTGAKMVRAPTKTLVMNVQAAAMALADLSSVYLKVVINSFYADANALAELTIADIDAKDLRIAVKYLTFCITSAAENLAGEIGNAAKALIEQTWDPSDDRVIAEYYAQNA
ncbi:hypothetical protein H4R99_006930 [Coemansia sp. RSA 1722]|nr:hypothetical protein IWW45_007667 [Coemansia sp. RSA 485]KAJ2590933.1 hypothetical protein H4R99_006930 [Coemansia sp. RSA 1722]